ncbi:MAG: IS200/IS605 family transposase [Pirellulaceae bacterium]
MSAHVFHEIYLHITWHTKDSYPLLTPKFEVEVHEFLRDRCRNTSGVYLHGINGTPTHVHVAMNIEPHVTISDLVGDLKGACSHELNKQKRMKRLPWQRGFGVVSFGKRNLPWVLAYVANQKSHHASGRVQRRLEKINLDDDGTPLEG